MNFLAPFYLVLAAGAGIPMLLHLLRRNAGAHVEFPAARYLQRAEREHSRSLRIRNLLLMVLRVLLVVALALAAARPFIAGVGRGHAPTAMAVVLDNSLSTTVMVGGVTTFQWLRDASGVLLRASAPGDRLWLVTADGHVRGGSREQLLAELARMTPIQGSGDLPLALRRAASAVQGAGMPMALVAVATDGQRTAWNTASPITTPLSLVEPRGDPPDNRAVVAAVAEPARWTPRGVIVAHIEARDSVGYRVLIGERMLARGIVGPMEQIVIRAAPPERGWQAGRIEMDPDDFPADDVRYFALWIGPPPAVAVDSSAGAFVSTALGSLIADGRAAIGPDVRVGSADVISALPALIVPPATPVRLGAANRALNRLGVPWHFGAVEHQPGIARGPGLDGVSVAERYVLVHDGASSSDTLATAAGSPWVVGGPGYVLIASRLDPSATTLPVRAPFVPWLADVLGRRLGAPAGDLALPVLAAAGDVLHLPDGSDELENSAGVRRTLLGTSVPAPEERGVWFILRRGRRVGAVVVNAPPEESVLARWSPVELANRLGGRSAHAARTSDGWVRATFSARAQHPALVPLLVLALVLLASEAVVVRTSRTSRSIIA